MSKILLEFQNLTISIALNNNANTKAWINLHKNLEIQPDTIISNTPINKEELRTAIENANKKFNFNWPVYPNNQTQFNKMHKDIETLQEDQVDLIHNVHNFLHTYESKGNFTNVQISWAKNLGQFYKEKPIKVPLEEVNFAKEWHPGEVIIGYPHVGRSPHSCMITNDNMKLQQTCKLHDHISTDFIINVSSKQQTDDNKLSKWYDQNSQVLKNIFTKDQGLNHNGYLVIGKVENFNKLPYKISLPLHTQEVPKFTLVFDN